jgi:RNA polymerase sigma factor (TIGR02999 family)
VPERPDITEILLGGEARFPVGNGLLFEAVYHELREIAARLMRSQRDDHTLQPTALVHEAYLKLADASRVSWEGRAHFLRVAARAMRQILINHARDRSAQKRGGGWTRVTLTEDLAGSADRALEILDLNDALERLAKKDERLAQVVELRVFAGMTVVEVAHVLGVSPRTVDGEWKVAKMWLLDELLPEAGS